MNCPACERPLQPVRSEGVTVDACVGGCGGIWFDAFEMQKVDETHETAGQELLNIDVDASLRVDLEQRRNCPRCESLLMLRHRHRDNPAVMVDECPGCGGFWLDAGELGLIRQSQELQLKKRAHTQALLEQLKQQSLAGLQSPTQPAARHRTITTIRSFFSGQPE